MGFFRDIISGGGRLYGKVVPKEIRKMVPKEISPGGFDPARDWLGYDINVDPAKQAAQAQALKQQQEAAAAQSAFNQAGNLQIPGFPGGMPGGPPPGLLAGLAPPQGHLTQIQEQPVTQFQPQGPYAAQAMQMAGLLAPPLPQDPMSPGGGLLDDPNKDPRYPRYRPNGGK